MKKIFQLNGKRLTPLLGDKVKMYNYYHEFLGRAWLYPAESSLEQFNEFIETHPRFVVKPRFGSGGRGIAIQTIRQQKNVEPIFRTLANKDVIVEEIISQNSALNCLYPRSVNTVRISTLLSCDGLNIMGATLRMGNRGSVTDNHVGGGLAASIDLKTGIVCTPGIDKFSKRNICHPDTGQQIIGFRIPYWQETKQFVRKASEIYPRIHYVGWDVAITSKGPILVEVNSRPSINVHQQPEQKGKRLFYKNVLDKGIVISD